MLKIVFNLQHRQTNLLLVTSNEKLCPSLLYIHYSIQIEATRYQVSNTAVKSDHCDIFFDYDLLRFSLRFARSDHKVTHSKKLRFLFSEIDIWYFDCSML